jgi:hypothetical protein
MIRVSVEVREGTVTRRAEITAPSVARALDLAGAGKHGRRVRLLFPMEDPETFFVPTAHHVRGVA